MMLLDKNQVSGVNASHHNIDDYLPVKAHSIVFYNALNWFRRILIQQA